MPTWSAKAAGATAPESSRARVRVRSAEPNRHGAMSWVNMGATSSAMSVPGSIREVADMPCVFVAPDRSMTCVGQCSDEALADSFGGSFSARGGIEFGEDVGDVGLGGAGADEELISDLSVRQPLGDESQHLPHPLGEQCRLVPNHRHLIDRGQDRLDIV